MLPATLIALLATSGGPATAAGATTASTALASVQVGRRRDLQQQYRLRQQHLSRRSLLYELCRHKLHHVRRTRLLRGVLRRPLRRRLIRHELHRQEGGRRVLRPSCVASLGGCRAATSGGATSAIATPTRWLGIQLQRATTTTTADNYSMAGSSTADADYNGPPIPMGPSTHTVQPCWRTDAPPGAPPLPLPPPSPPLNAPLPPRPARSRASRRRRVAPAV